MTGLSEKAVESTVTKYAVSKGWASFKFASPACRGVPDRMFLKGGFCLFIEFKAPGGKTTPLQDKRIGELRDQGMVVHIIDNVSDGLELLNLFDRSFKAGKWPHVPEGYPWAF